jgi:hypothetical protein
VVDLKSLGAIAGTLFMCAAVQRDESINYKFDLAGPVVAKY